MSEIKQLLNAPLRPGKVEWIGIAKTRRGKIEQPDSVDVEQGTGIVGEHHARSGKSKRQVSLIQYEHLSAVAAFLGLKDVPPELLRRNLVISGINLLALKERRFQIGSAIFCGSGPCAPCSRMEENLGEGGYAAVRGHGGIVAIVVQSGRISLGDSVIALADENDDSSSES